jgi:hypothetical protein
MTGTFNWTLEQGTDVNMIFTWTSNGSPVDLTGYSAHLTVASANATAQTRTIYLDLTSAAGGLVLGGTAGTIQIVITNTVTSMLFWQGAAAWDLKLTAPSGKVTRLLQGMVLFSPQVTV